MCCSTWQDHWTFLHYGRHDHQYLLLDMLELYIVKD
jgi:hypothetical protein